MELISFFFLASHLPSVLFFHVVRFEPDFHSVVRGLRSAGPRVLELGLDSGAAGGLLATEFREKYIAFLEF